MKRRNFLSTLGAGALVPAMINGFSIRAFSASPLLRALAAASSDDHVLVLIQLGGGNDGLNTVLPLDQYGNLSAARSNILIPSSRALLLNGYAATGLHPAMTGMQELFNNGQAAIVQGASYPSPNFSHFQATDIWLTASDNGQNLTSGWAGRYLNYEYPNYPTGYPNSSVPDPLAIQIGTTLSLALQGPTVNMGITIPDLTSFYNIVSGTTDPAPADDYGTELTYIRTVAMEADAYSAVIQTAANNITQQSSLYPPSGQNSLADQLKIVSRLIAGGLQTKIYMVGISGFDNHSNQVSATDTTTGAHATLLGQVSQAVFAFMDDLNFLSVADRVVGMTFSEFGRRIISNGSLGTDHGVGAPMFLFGTSVQNGILGTNPVIPAGATVNDNVAMQYDFRSVYASVLADWLCVPTPDLSQIMLQSFQHLPIIQSGLCTTDIHELNKKAGLNLVSCYPNPFTSRTNVTFTTQGGHTLVQVFNAEGKLMKTLVNGDYTAGTYKADYENEGHAPGLYYLRLQNEAIQQVKNMAVVR